MGLDPDYEFGEPVPCAQNIDPPPWDPGEAPLYVWASFGGISLCNKCVGWFPQPPNPGIIRLKQGDPGLEHKWFGSNDNFTAEWGVCPPCFLKCATVQGPVVFYGIGPGGSVAFNQHWDCDDPMFCGDGGGGVVTWGALTGQALSIAGIADVPGTKFEFWPGKRDAPDICYKFAHPDFALKLLKSQYHP